MYSTETHPSLTGRMTSRTPWAFMAVPSSRVRTPYGIQVARLAGVPDIVTDRAKEIAAQLADNDISEKIESIAVDNKDQKIKSEHFDDVDLGQMTLFDTTTDQDVINELRDIDLESMRPIDALNRLYKLQNMLKNRW